MKRKEPIRRLRQAGCELVREGAKHSVYLNPNTGEAATVPRHTEIKERLAKKILHDLRAERGDPLQ